MARGLTSCGSWVLAQAQQSRATGLVARQRVESSQIGDQTRVSCIDRQVLYHWATREALEKTLESPPESKVIQPVHPKGDQPWIFIRKTDAEAEASIFWPPDAKSWLIGKDPDAGKDWGREEKGPTEDEMVGWHHQLSGHEFGWTLGDSDGQGGLVCCSPWGHKESNTTEQRQPSNSQSIPSPPPPPGWQLQVC